MTALPEIPVLDVGVDWPFEILQGQLDRVNALLDESAGRIPKLALKIADAVSRRWLEQRHPLYLEEIDRISARIARPGAYFLNLSFEWGCTSSVGPSPDGRSARLMRVLDWPDPGLGRHIVAVRIAGAAGSWLTLTWPGYTGVVQAIAPARFAAAINQAPMERPVGVYPADWVVNRLTVWKRPHLTPAHLLRQVFERAIGFGEAKLMLSETAIALPAIYVLAGMRPEEACVIERLPDRARVSEGPACAVNAWQVSGWPGRSRGEHNTERLDQIRSAGSSHHREFEWLRPPVLNRGTRLALVADAFNRSIIAQGFESEQAVTSVLRITI